MKMEKLRQKEIDRAKKRENKERRMKEKQKRKDARKAQVKHSRPQEQLTLDNFRASDEDPIPIFLRKAMAFIEQEGLEEEGIYRVPGNKSCVKQLFQEFDEGEGKLCLIIFSCFVNYFADKDIDFFSMHLKVNTVATAVKAFFNKIPPIFGFSHMDKLGDILFMTVSRDNTI